MLARLPAVARGCNRGLPERRVPVRSGSCATSNGSLGSVLLKAAPTVPGPWSCLVVRAGVWRRDVWLPDRCMTCTLLASAVCAGAQTDSGTVTVALAAWRAHVAWQYSRSTGASLTVSHCPDSVGCLARLAIPVRWRCRRRVWPALSRVKLAVGGRVYGGVARVHPPRAAERVVSAQ